MVKDPTIAVRDCLAEIAILESLATRMTLQDFLDDAITRRAAAFAVQTISEAVRRLPDDWLAEFADQPWPQIKAIGNRIRHEYFRIDDRMLWRVMTIDAPALRVVMEAMLRKHAP